MSDDIKKKVDSLTVGVPFEPKLPYAIDIAYVELENTRLNEVGNLLQNYKELEKICNKQKDLLLRMQSFFGIGRYLEYRDLDGKMYPLDMTELEKILSEVK